MGIEISLEKMVGETYKRIAEWHNEDGTAPGLKVAAHEVVEKVLNLAFEQLDVKTKTGIKEDAVKQTLETIKKNSEETSTPQEKNKNGDNKIFNKLF